MWRSSVLALVCTGLPALGDERELKALVEEALQARPELAQAAADLKAARERVPQAGAWPEPMLEVGVQNGSFTQWQVGKMEMSWVSFMASQTFPFPGKPGFREEVARSDVRLSELVAERVRLSTIAEVRRGYLALQVLRERRALLEKLAALNGRLVEVARIRVESGAGSQAELLRAQVELGRITQRRARLEGEEQVQLQALNQLRRKPLDTAIPTSGKLDALPALLSEAEIIALGKARSPELLAARAGITRAEASASLARRSYFPDLSVSAGVMVRGALEPMWAVTLGVPLPVFAGGRQARSIAEAGAQRDSATQGAESIELLLELRARQRAQSMKALTAVWNTWQAGLLAQADAAAQSTLAQYAAGRAGFAEVLEANAVSISEVEASLEVLAEAWRLAIAQDELSPSGPVIAAPSPSPSPSPGM